MRQFGPSLRLRPFQFSQGARRLRAPPCLPRGRQGTYDHGMSVEETPWNPIHLVLIKKGAKAIEVFRDANHGVRLALRGAPLIGVDLIGADLRRADLDGASLRGAFLTRTELRDASLSGTDLSGANLTDANLTVVRLIRADLTGANLRGANLHGSDLRGATLCGATLCGANLSRADISRANLSRSNLTGANLRDTDLREADLTGANLTVADLTDTDLTGANLRNTNLAGANLTGVAICGEDGSNEADLHGANLDRAAYGPRMRQPEVGTVELATARGLEHANWPDLPRYLELAIAEATNADSASSKKQPRTVESALARIKAIRALLESAETPPAELVEVVSLVSKELVAHLKKHPDELRQVKPRQFEELVAEILESFGWTVVLTPATDDGGYDILAIAQDVNGKRSSWIVECKKYAEANKIEVDLVRSLYGIRNTMKVNGAMLATTSDFTKGARRFQEDARMRDGKTSRYHFDLRNYTSVLEWINDYRPHPDGKIMIKDDRLWIPGQDDVPPKA